MNKDTRSQTELLKAMLDNRLTYCDMAIGDQFWIDTKDNSRIELECIGYDNSHEYPYPYFAITNIVLGDQE